MLLLKLPTPECPCKFVIVWLLGRMIRDDFCRFREEKDYPRPAVEVANFLVSELLSRVLIALIRSRDCLPTDVILAAIFFYFVTYFLRAEL